ncbi:MAG: hypothetical protein CVV48_04715 [Spirochaetae bacterium HGW-Spirochaetae-4]|nr:MAG: hypothetical protein CVV48_04715 [Spirochaetae bacterium HGW-Spirochaetae-4]
MKIILAHYKFYIQGGPETYLFKFMKLAEKHGNTVIPFSVNYVQNLESDYSTFFVRPEYYKKFGRFDSKHLSLITILKGSLNEFHNFEARRKLSRLIKGEKPDLLYVLIPGLLTPDIFKVAKNNSVPVILRLSDFRLLCGRNTLLRGYDICEKCIYGDYSNGIKFRCVHNSIPLSILRMLALRYHRNHKSYSFVDAVITPPKYTKDKFIESGYFPKEKMFVNPTFIDCSQTKTKREHKNYVLCLGRFSPEKGFIYVVEAMKYLQDIPVKVAITGDREDCDIKLANLIKRFNLEKKVEYLGFQNGKYLNKIISEAMCVACPAIWYENLPNAILEAYSFGKPVIASNLGSLSEIVEDKKTGLLFNPKDVEQIASCIRILYEDPVFCVALGQNARAKCEKEYSPDLHWSNFIEIYRRAMKNYD